MHVLLHIVPEMRRGTALPCPYVRHRATSVYIAAPWHFLNFLPLPQGQGSLRPTPAYGLATGPPPAGGGPSLGGAPASGLTRPSAAGLLATIGGAFLGAPPNPPIVWVELGPPRGGPISICSLSHRSVNVAFRSCIRPTNIS